MSFESFTSLLSFLFLRPHMHQHIPLAPVSPVLPDVDPLPGAEPQLAVEDRNPERRGRQGRLDAHFPVLATENI